MNDQPTREDVQRGRDVVPLPTYRPRWMSAVYTRTCPYLGIRMVVPYGPRLAATDE